MGRSDFIRAAKLSRGLPDILASASRVSASSLSAYSTAWKSWLLFCSEKDYDFRCPVDVQVAEFARARAEHTRARGGCKDVHGRTKNVVSAVTETFRQAYGWHFAAADVVRDALQSVRHDFPVASAPREARDLRVIFDHLARPNAELTYQEHWTKVITLLQLDSGGRVQNTRGVQRIGAHTRMVTRSGDDTLDPNACEYIRLQYRNPKRAGGQAWSDWVTLERPRATRIKRTATYAKNSCFVEAFCAWARRVGQSAYADGPDARGMNVDVRAYGQTPFVTETGYAPMRKHMAAAICDTLVASGFMSKDEARSHETRAHAESAWRHIDAPQLDAQAISVRTMHSGSTWKKAYFIPQVQRVRTAYESLNDQQRSDLRWCELLRM